MSDYACRTSYKLLNSYGELLLKRRKKDTDNKEKIALI